MYKNRNNAEIAIKQSGLFLITGQISTGNGITHFEKEKVFFLVALVSVFIVIFETAERSPDRVFDSGHVTCSGVRRIKVTADTVREPIGDIHGKC